MAFWFKVNLNIAYPDKNIDDVRWWNRQSLLTMLPFNPSELVASRNPMSGGVPTRASCPQKS